LVTFWSLDSHHIISIYSSKFVSKLLGSVDQAKLAIVNRQEKVAALDEKIEDELELIGSTAIEDKL
jgi:magnesium-transporting ATPase (P-type)